MGYMDIFKDDQQQQTTATKPTNTDPFRQVADQFAGTQQASQPQQQPKLTPIDEPIQTQEPRSLGGIVPGGGGLPGADDFGVGSGGDWGFGGGGDANVGDSSGGIDEGAGGGIIPGTDPEPGAGGGTGTGGVRPWNPGDIWGTDENVGVGDSSGGIDEGAGGGVQPETEPDPGFGDWTLPKDWFDRWRDVRGDLPEEPKDPNVGDASGGIDEEAGGGVQPGDNEDPGPGYDDVKESEEGDITDQLTEVADSKDRNWWLGSDQANDWITQYMNTVFGGGDFDPTKQLIEQQRDEALRGLYESAAARGMGNSGWETAQAGDIYQNAAGDMSRAYEQFRRNKVGEMQGAAGMIQNEEQLREQFRQQENMARLATDLEKEGKAFDVEQQKQLAEFMDHISDQNIRDNYDYQKAMAEFMLQIDRRQKFGEDYNADLGDYEIQLLRDLMTSDSLDSQGKAMMQDNLYSLYGPDRFFQIFGASDRLYSDQAGQEWLSTSGYGRWDEATGKWVFNTTPENDQSGGGGSGGNQNDGEFRQQ